MAQDTENLIHTKYFINEVYRISPPVYFDTRSKLTSNSKYLPDKKEIELFDIHDLGEECTKRLNPDENTKMGDNRSRLSSIKNKYGSAYAELIGIPKTEITATKTKFMALHQEIFDQPKIFIDEVGKELVAEYCLHSLSATTSVFWIETDRADSNGTLEALVTEKVNLVFDVHLPMEKSIEDAAKLFRNRNCIFVFCGEKDLSEFSFYQKICGTFERQIEKNHARNKWITNRISDTNAAAKTQIELTETTKPEMPAKKKYFSSLNISLFSIAIVLLIMFVINSFESKSKVEMILKFYYHGSDPIRDEFYGGANLVWLDSTESTIQTEITELQCVNFIKEIPSNAAQLFLYRGSFEIFPNHIEIPKQKVDTLFFTCIRKITIGDWLDEEIIKESAQRWFAFSVKEPTMIEFSAEAADGQFIPQMAIYKDLFEQERFSFSSNSNGVMNADTTSAFLYAGNYFLKVRGYDNSTGKFKLKSSKKAIVISNQ